MQRRSFLKHAAIVSIAVANGEVWRAYGQDSSSYGEGPAFEPWKTWRKDASEGPLALVRAAILSSNAYNSQPWLFEVAKSKIKLFADTRRNLGAFDPYLRELHISLGCALENLQLAAGANGYRTSLRIQPGKLEPVAAKPEPRLIAEIDLSPGKHLTNELYEAIPDRHTNRQPFDAQRPLPSGFVDALERTSSDYKDVKVFAFTAEPDRRKLVDLVASSSKFVADQEVQRGVRPWIRSNMEDLEKFRDGAYVGPGGDFKPTTLEDYKALMMSGPLFGVIGVKDRYDVQQAVRAGQTWQRAHLLATSRGLAARPANGAAEIIDHERRLNQEPHTLALLAEIIGDANCQPTFMFYMGYATASVKPSPRRDVRDVLM
jgi:hypothetical protein